MPWIVYNLPGSQALPVVWARARAVPIKLASVTRTPCDELLCSEDAVLLLVVSWSGRVLFDQVCVIRPSRLNMLAWIPAETGQQALGKATGIVQKAVALSWIDASDRLGHREQSPDQRASQGKAGLVQIRSPSQMQSS